VRTFSRTTQFKKDVKLAGKRGKDLPKFKAALERLIEGAPLPAEFKDHPLRGNFAGSRDSHIEPEWGFVNQPDKHASISVPRLQDSFASL